MPMKCVIVTPERTQLDKEVRSVVLPMVDGQLGVLENRAPLVGRLGYGLLTFEATDGTSSELYVDGGFVQIENNVVSVLTSRAVAPTTIDPVTAQKSLEEALAMPGSGPAAQAIKATAVARARGQLTVANSRRA